MELSHERIINNSCGRKSENLLEFFDCVLRVFSKDAVYGNFRKSRIGVGNGIKLFLYLSDLTSG